MADRRMIQRLASNDKIAPINPTLVSRLWVVDGPVCGYHDSIGSTGIGRGTEQAFIWTVPCLDSCCRRYGFWSSLAVSIFDALITILLSDYPTFSPPFACQHFPSSPRPNFIGSVFCFWAIICLKMFSFSESFSINVYLVIIWSDIGLSSLPFFVPCALKMLFSAFPSLRAEQGMSG